MTGSPADGAPADAPDASGTEACSGSVASSFGRWMAGADRRRRSQLVRDRWTERLLAVTFRLPWLIPLVALVAMLAVAVAWPGVFAAPAPPGVR